MDIVFVVVCRQAPVDDVVDSTVCHQQRPVDDAVDSTVCRHQRPVDDAVDSTAACNEETLGAAAVTSDRQSSEQSAR